MLSPSWQSLDTTHPHTPRDTENSLTQAELCGELPLGSSSLTISRLLWCTATCSGVRPFWEGERAQTGETEPLPVPHCSLTPLPPEQHSPSPQH